MMSPEEIMSQASSPGRSTGMSRKKKYIIAACVFAVILIIVVPVAVALDRNAKENAAIAQLRTLVVNALKKENVDTSGIEDGSTHQGKAFNWLYFNNPDVFSMDRTKVLERYSLAALYYSTYQVATAYTPNPPIWVTSNRWLSSDDACDWEGIACNNRGRVDGIALESNALTGKLPADLALLREHVVSIDVTTNLLYMEPADLEFLGFMTKLETLLLDDNYIYTEDGLPDSLGACTNLKKLRLSYNLMGGTLSGELFRKLSMLEHLEIESNFFSGSMPAEIGVLKELVYMYMRRNSMEFNLDFIKPGAMTNVFAMWLDANSLTGSIPTEIGLLTELASLSITNGTLKGEIPTEMGNLLGLRRAWLYGNGLSGTIPLAMQNLTLLEVFEVQDNDLSGTMPEGVCTTVNSQTYQHKSLAADCQQVECPLNSCCTTCVN